MTCRIPPGASVPSPVHELHPITPPHRRTCTAFPTPTSPLMQQMWDEHVESMDCNRAEEQRRQLRKGLIAVAVALVLFVVILVLF